MEQQDQKVSKVVPVATGVASPVAKHAVDNGAQIELCTKNIKHSASIDAGGGESCLVNLECVSALGWLHGQVDDWVELDGLLVNLDRVKGLGNKHVVRLEQAGALVRHDDATIKRLGST